MPAVNISGEAMRKIEELIETYELSPSKREVAGEAVDVLYEQRVENSDNN